MNPSPMRAVPAEPAGRRLALPGAAWRLLRLAGLIAGGWYTVQRGFPQMAPAARHAAVQAWARRVVGVLDVDVQLVGALSPGTRMLVANHVSWLDVMVVHAVCPQARFVAKADVRGWPVVGALVAGAGSLFVDRHRPRQARRSLAQITEVLREGGLVAVFAEGTTTDGRQVLPFKAGLLQAATAVGCGVQALALRYREGGQPGSTSVPYIGDDSLLQSLWRLCRAREVGVTLTVLPPRDAGQADRRHLASSLHADVKAALALPLAAP